MDVFRDISDCIGTEDFPADFCQSYLDQPAGTSYDNSDVFVPNLDQDALTDIMRKIRECDSGELEDSGIIIYVKRFAAAALSTVNNSSDADGIAAALRLLIQLCNLPGASAYGVCNSHILRAISNNMGKLCTLVLKAPTKRLTPKEKDAVEEKKSKKKEKSSLKKAGKAGKNGKFDDEEEDGASGDSDDEQPEEAGGFSRFSQSSQMTQPFDDDEDVESPNQRRVVGQVSYAAMKKLFSDLKSSLPLYSVRSEDSLTDSCVDALVSVSFLAAVKPDFSGLSKDALAALSVLGISSEFALMAVYRSLMPALTTAGRDLRIPDGSKVRILCHRAAVQVVLAVVALTPKLTWGTAIAQNEEQVMPDSSEVSEEKAEGDMDEEAAEGEVAVEAPETPAQSSTELPTPYICAVGALQRMTVKVPDKSNWRNLVLNSILLVLSRLQIVERCGGEEILADNAPKGYCPIARFAATKYLSFLQKLSKSNKIGFRAFSLDIITECMSEEWLWSTPLKITDADAPVGDNSDDTKVYARSLLSMALLRCSDVAPTVRIRALGALSGLLSKLKDKGHSNPIGMCSSVLDLALGFLEDSEAEPVPVEDPGSDQESDTPVKKTVISTNLFEILRTRLDDDKPLVRVKAIQTFGAALGLNYPKWTRKIAGQDEMEGESCEKETVSMLITADDVTMIFDKCGDQSLSTRKQALSSLSDLVSARPAITVIQDAWVAGCLSLAGDPESSVQAKLASCAFDLIVGPSVQWAKSEAPLRDSVETGLVWQLCCKISQSGRSNSLKSSISTMLKQGLIKATADCGGGSSSLSVVLQAVKAACCDESEVVFRGGWVLLEALTDSDENSAAMTSNMEMTTVSSRVTSDSSSVNLIGSSNFVFDCFFRKRNQVQGPDSITALDQDDERILKVLKKITDSISLPNLMKTKTFLLSVLNSLLFSPSICSIVIATIFAISKSIAKLTVKVNQNMTETEKEDALKTFFYADVQRWSGELLLIVYRALHTAVWAKEIEEAKLYELFGTDSGKADKISIPILANSRKAALIATFEPTPKDLGNSFEASFWNVDKSIICEKSTEAGREMVIAAVFLLGEISMLGFTLEEDEGTSQSQRQNVQSNLPHYTISEISKSFKIVLPKKVISLTQMLMSTFLPVNEDGEPSLSQSYVNINSTQNETTQSNGKECNSVVRAHAFVTMGKFCLRDKNMARSHVNIFLRELHTSNTSDAVARAYNPSVRSNALFVLGDMCVRYTALVDRHIGVLAGCLQDRSVLVRKHALILLTQLLLQDYIKWRGLLLFRFLATAIDKDEEMCEFARSILQKTLNVKYPDFFAVHFCECLLVMNNCTDHPVFVAVASSGADGDSCPVNIDGVDLLGPKRRNPRLRLYAFMMADFTAEQKIQVTARIVQDLLSYAVDYLAGKHSSGGDDSHTPFEEALRDALLVLQSPLLKVGTQKASANADNEEDEDLEEEEAGVGKAIEKAKNKVLKKLSLQHLLGHMLPVVTSLKLVLETSNSHLQRPLMDYLVTFVKAHKTEVYQAMAQDPGLSDLKAEIEYEMKLSEKNFREKVARNRLSSDHFDFDWEKPSAQAEPAVEPTGCQSPTPAMKRMSLSTPKKQAEVSCHQTPISGNATPYKATPNKNGRNIAFLSPLQSSKKSSKKPSAENAPAKSVEKARFADSDDDDKKEEKRRHEKENVLSRQSRRRSWGVVVSNLSEGVEDEENKDANIPPVREKGGKGSKSNTDKNSVSAANKKRIEKEANMDFEMRFTPSKKKTTK